MGCPATSPGRACSLVPERAAGAPDSALGPEAPGAPEAGPGGGAAAASAGPRRPPRADGVPVGVRHAPRRQGPRVSVLKGTMKQVGGMQCTRAVRRRHIAGYEQDNPRMLGSVKELGLL